MDELITDLERDVAIERRVSHDLFQLAVFVAQRPEFAPMTAVSGTYGDHSWPHQRSCGDDDPAVP